MKDVGTESLTPSAEFISVSAAVFSWQFGGWTAAPKGGRDWNEAERKTKVEANS